MSSIVIASVSVSKESPTTGNKLHALLYQKETLVQQIEALKQELLLLNVTLEEKKASLLEDKAK